MTDLESRIFLAIAKSTPTKQPAAVIAEIETTHVLVPRSLAERAQASAGNGADASRARIEIVLDLAEYLDPIRHDAAKSDI